MLLEELFAAAGVYCAATCPVGRQLLRRAEAMHALKLSVVLRHLSVIELQLVLQQLELLATLDGLVWAHLLGDLLRRIIQK